MPRTKALEIKAVSFRYQGNLVLENVSLAVGEGEFLALIGPNGAGKTTLLKLILGLLPLQEGEIFLFGKPLAELGPLRHQIGYVPQGSTIDRRFPITVEEFALTGRYGLIGVGRRPKSSDYQSVQQALARVHLESFRQKPIQALSGGQWQRLLVARALACEPRILFLDEPTTAIDPEGSESLYGLLLLLRNQGVTIVTVSHDVGVIAEYADRMACLNRTIICHDRPEEVISAESLKDMYGKEAAFFHHGEIPHIVVRKTPTPCYQPKEEQK